MNKEIEISPRQISSAITNLLNEKEKLHQENKELHNKIDKAIEYINDNVAVYAFNNKDLPHWEFNDDEIKILLEILKDSDIDE